MAADPTQVIQTASTVASVLLPQYAQLIAVATPISLDLVQLILGYAKKTLSHEDYTALELSWQADVVESARNAGIPAEPDTPLT